tara:strand:- start:185 stop:337 length:153 start_codon:yes stop_codon:yes gene_type:complete
MRKNNILILEIGIRLKIFLIKRRILSLEIAAHLNSLLALYVWIRNDIQLH